MTHFTKICTWLALVLSLFMVSLTEGFSTTIQSRSSLTVNDHSSNRKNTLVVETRHLPISRLSFTSSSLSMAESSDGSEKAELDDTFGDFIENLVEDIKSPSRQQQQQQVRPMSKGKMKKKRYLWMQDVQKMVYKHDPKAVKKAEEMVKRIRKQNEIHGLKMDDEDLITTNQKAYNVWIHALAKSNIENSGARAEEAMALMRTNGIPPNAFTYTSIMAAYAKNFDPERAEELMFQWLEEMERESEGGGGGLPEQRANEVTCDTILNAWAKQGTVQSAERAQLILYRLEEFQNEHLHPTTISYTTVMNAWARVRTLEGAEKAEALLRRMLMGDRDKKHKVPLPDTVAFNAAIDAWAKSGSPLAGEKAADILETMKKAASQKRDDGLLLNCQPDAITYNIVLSAWSHSGRTDAAPQVERLIQQMEKAAESDKKAPRPNTISYNTILHAWSKSDLDLARPRVDKVLNYMLKAGRKEIAPDRFSFTTAMDAWAKSKEPNKASKCRKMLDLMLQTHKTTRRANLKPSDVPFNTVLNACAFSSLGTSEEEQREALKIAVATYKDMRREGIEATSVTYGNLIKCFANLMPQGDARTKMALQVFDNCCKDGMVGNLVWNEVRRAVPGVILDKKYRLKKRCGNMELRDLPRNWKQRNRFDTNAPKSKRPEPERKQKRPPGSFSIIETAGQSGRDL